jgi:hypothetical protein
VTAATDALSMTSNVLTLLGPLVVVYGAFGVLVRTSDTSPRESLLGAGGDGGADLGAVHFSVVRSRPNLGQDMNPAGGTRSECQLRNYAVVSFWKKKGFHRQQVFA